MIRRFPLSMTVAMILVATIVLAISGGAPEAGAGWRILDYASLSFSVDVTFDLQNPVCRPLQDKGLCWPHRSRCLDCPGDESRRRVIQCLRLPDRTMTCLTGRRSQCEVIGAEALSPEIENGSVRCARGSRTILIQLADGALRSGGEQ